MENESRKVNMMNVMLVEFFSVLIFTLAYNLDDGSHKPQLVWFILFVMTWRISGAHCNPAITLAVWIEQKNYEGK